MRVDIINLGGADLTIRDFEDAFVRVFTDPEASGEIHFSGVGKRLRWYSFQVTGMGMSVTKERL